MTQVEAVSYWLISAQRNLETAQDMFKTNHYDWCLFMWHLVIEKSLKAVISKQGKTPLATHNLTRLVDQAGLKLSDDKQDNLKEITSFNLETRYDDYKFAFYKKANKSFAQKWVKICQNLYQEFSDLCNQK